MRAQQWFLYGVLVIGPFGSAHPAEDKSLSLTIYNSDLALIEHVRPFTASAGKNRVDFDGVSAQIIPETVGFSAAGMEIIEQNFDYDLLTPSKLMEKAVGQKVRLVRTNPATGAQTEELADVLSVNGGVVLKVGDRIEVLREDGLPSRVIFDKVPPNLRATPTLSVLVNAKRSTTEDVRLTYLSKGLTWSADYVALFDEVAGSVKMQGWITLKNTSGTGFANARVQLVAGTVNVSTDESIWWQRYNYLHNSQQRNGGAEASGRQQLLDYYVYPIDPLTTIANNQTKQVSFLSADGVKANKGYELVFYGFESLPEPRSAEVRVRFANSKAGGMGEPLPKGIVRVYARDTKSQPQFVGEDRIGHTSAGSQLSIKIGDAFDVTVQPTLKQTTKVSRLVADYEMSYVIRNARSVPVTVTVRQDGLWRFNEIRRESIKSRRIDAGSIAWDVAVPANGETELSAVIRN